MGDEIKRQQDLEKQLGGSLPPGGRVVEGDDGQRKPPPPKKKGPDPIKDLKKKMDEVARGARERHRGGPEEAERAGQGSPSFSSEGGRRRGPGGGRRDEARQARKACSRPTPRRCRRTRTLRSSSAFWKIEGRAGPTRTYASREAKKDDPEDDWPPSEIRGAGKPPKFSSEPSMIKPSPGKSGQGGRLLETFI